MSKYGYLRNVLLERGVLQAGGYAAPVPAGMETIALAHDLDYVQRVFSLELRPDETRRIGLPHDERLLRRTRLSSAGTTLAAWLALEQGIACNMAGGSHHAAHAGGAGFCVFNDVAVAALSLLHQGVAGPFAVVDADVHQGDGTADIFDRDGRVFTLSIHAEKNFPARKAQSNIDIGLPDGLGDTPYLEALKSGLDQLFETISPRLVFYNAGVDVHIDDRLGRLGLSTEGVRARDALVISETRRRQVPLVGVLGGGYSDDVEALAIRHAILFEEAAKFHSQT